MQGRARLEHLCWINGPLIMADVRGHWRRFPILILLGALAPVRPAAQPNDAVRALAQREKQPLLNTLKALVEIESGSADLEGITRIGALIAVAGRRENCGNHQLSASAAVIGLQARERPPCVHPSQRQ